jgi:hypothetical protein
MIATGVSTALAACISDGHDDAAASTPCISNLSGDQRVAARHPHPQHDAEHRALGGGR